MTLDELPSYATSLDAMAEPVAWLIKQSNIRDRESVFAKYFHALHAICAEHEQADDGGMVPEQWAISATARQQLDSFLVATGRARI